MGGYSRLKGSCHESSVSLRPAAPSYESSGRIWDSRKENWPQRLNTTREGIDYYEPRVQNPRLDLIQGLAGALEVAVAELLGSEPPVRARPGPVPQLQLRFEQIKQLPH